MRRLANVLDKLPKRLQPKAKRALREIMYADCRADAESLIERFGCEYEEKYPRAVASLVRDREQLLTFFDFPGAHWQHIRTTNPIESAFSTVRLRQRVTKGAGTRTKGLTMAFKLLAMAQDRWRRLRSPHLVSLVRDGVTFSNGIQVEQRQPTDRKVAA